MAGPHTFIGSISGDFGVAGNFDTSAVPADAEGWQVNHLTERSIDAGLNQSTKTFSAVSIGPGFQNKKIGNSAADPFLCNATKLQVTGSPLGTYIKGACTDVVADMASLAKDGLVLEGALTRVQVLRGRVRVEGSDVQPANSVWFCGSDDDSVDDLESCQLDIGEDCDLVTNDTKLVLAAGRIRCGPSVDDVLQKGGEFNLGSLGEPGSEVMYTAACALFWMLGGTFRWKGDGTIAAGHVAGGYFSCNDYDLVRTLTNMTMYGSGQASFRLAHHVIYSNPIRVLGRYEPEYPIGHTLTVG